ncbi:Non-structural maintenance of chromosomes element 1-like protein [Frankliniella fusca]|uniref:Non-structural maintenance of chromosomes element 1 homolog n=1 Tax=Frankliniella fusca TaxID=407009 RepID=A0AAE1LR11_9NEOP|nr:Non-structural maintenance of chromosomes element 1-like protein [Frankliniella fusca]
MAGISYTDMHRMYLQAIMSRAIISRISALRLLKEVTALLGYRSPIKDSDVSETIAEINTRISEFGQEIKEIRSEKDGEEFIVFVNLVDNSTIFEKVNHAYTIREREVFRLLLEAVVMAGTYGSVSTMDALHLNVPNMKAGEIQDTIDKLVSDQWFLETDSGRLVPAPRLIAEFDMYLKNNFHDHVNVCLCNNVVFYGVQCPHCDHISHRHCFILFNRRNTTTEHKCPSCKALVVQENGDTEEQTPQPRGGSSRSSSQQRNGNTPETPDNTPALPCEPSDASEPMDTTPAPTRGRRKRRSNT